MYLLVGGTTGAEGTGKILGIVVGGISCAPWEGGTRLPSR
jgi:hypothetical protein